MRYEVRLNNKSIYDISSGVRIVDVTENEPKESVKTAVLAKGNGTRLLDSRRDSLTVSVTVALRDESMLSRTRAYDNLLGWARGGGYLTLGDRPGQRLWIDRVELPGLGSVKKWYGSIDMTLTAYARPYWESVFPSVAAISTAATSGSATLMPPGTAEECPVDAEITASSATVNSLTVTAGGTSISFASLGLSKGKTLSIDHGENGMLRLRVGDASVMDKRTAQSSDDLLARPGTGNAVTFTASAACTAKFSARGRWL